MTTMNESIKAKIAYFGGEPLGNPVLKILLRAGIKPALVVTSPDRRSGRGQHFTPPPVKKTAEANGLPVWQPEQLPAGPTDTPLAGEWDLFVVVAYPKILPKWLIELPKRGTINLHPSLLPKLRGPSPIRSAILRDEPEAVGVSIIKLDEKMDAGPILYSKPYKIPDPDWPVDGRDLDTKLAEQGGEALAKVIPDWLANQIKPTNQNHEQATYTNKLSKDMGELSIDPHRLPSDQAAKALIHKIKGLAGWPGTYFFHEAKRVKIVAAKLSATGRLEILEVTPENKQTMSFRDWLRSQ